MMAKQAFKRGQFVRYCHGETGCIEAKVLRAHRDGSCTVEATFFVGLKGERQTGYLGYHYRIHNTDLIAA
jgi:hypothetical protein